MNAQRVKALMGATITGSAAAALASFAAPLSAQMTEGQTLNIMRECAKIDDPTARLACYDNNIRSGIASGVIPGANGRVTGGGAVIAGGSNSGPEGFGAASVKSDDRFKSSEERGQGPSEIRAKVVSARQREAGVWAVVIEGGAEWTFSESVPNSFRVPRKGAIVELQRAALGSFMMIVDGQKGVRVRRTK